MGQGITVTSGYGWVVDEFDGHFPDGLAEQLPYAIREGTEELHAWLQQSIDDDGFELELLTFGYEFHSLALLAEGSSNYSYDWYHDLSKLSADRAKEPAYRRELLKARDELGLSALGEPKWLLLVLYG